MHEFNHLIFFILICITALFLAKRVNRRANKIEGNLGRLFNCAKVTVPPAPDTDVQERGSPPVLKPGLMPLTRKMLEPYEESGCVKAPGYSGLQRALPSTFFVPTYEAADLFHFFDNEEDVEDTLQVVPVLAFRGDFPVRLVETRDWFGIIHQCGGHSCHQVAMIGTILKPSPAISPKLNDIARRFYYCAHGRLDYGQRLVSHIVDYSSALEKIGLDCRSSYDHLVEALYPVDPTDDNILTITGDQDLLEDLRKDGIARGPLLTFGKPCIFLLTENSD